MMTYYQRKVRVLMQCPLPTKTAQKRLMYRPTPNEVSMLYDLLNLAIFEGKLTKPPIILKRMYKVWGTCGGDYIGDRPVCVDITLSDKYYAKQWLITILAHEMAHQWQWEIQGKERQSRNLPALMNHRSCFFEHKERMMSMGVPLKSWHRTSKWFLYQDPLRM